MRHLLTTILAFSICLVATAKPTRANLGGDSPKDSKKNLPYDAVVEYLGSTGTQYIDLGLNSTSDGFYDFELDFALHAVSSTVPFGYAYGATARYGLWNDSANWYIGANNSNSIDLGAKDTGRHHVRTHFGASVEIDGDMLAIGGGSVRANIGMNLFARVSSASGATSRSLSAANVYGFKIWNTAGDLLRDMIPVRITNEQGQREGAMYDRINGSIYRNVGNGAFVIGPDKR